MATLLTSSNVPSTNIASAISSTTLLAANTNRLGVMIWNDSTAILYVKYGPTASATSCTVKLGADEYFEFPDPIYMGIVTGIWGAANGSARITEVLTNATI